MNSGIYIGNSDASVDALAEIIMKIVNSAAADAVKVKAMECLHISLGQPKYSTISNCSFTIGEQSTNEEADESE